MRLGADHHFHHVRAQRAEIPRVPQPHISAVKETAIATEVPSRLSHRHVEHVIRPGPVVIRAQGARIGVGDSGVADVGLIGVVRFRGVLICLGARGKIVPFIRARPRLCVLERDPGGYAGNVTVVIVIVRVVSFVVAGAPRRSGRVRRTIDVFPRPAGGHVGNVNYHALGAEEPVARAGPFRRSPRGVDGVCSFLRGQPGAVHVQGQVAGTLALAGEDAAAGRVAGRALVQRDDVGPPVAQQRRRLIGRLGAQADGRSFFLISPLCWQETQGGGDALLAELRAVIHRKGHRNIH